ncbi:MAG: hypothetical protein PHH47_07565 [Gallionella sp.]|nr:hypothetical protein [Gallionella sp.]MDD4945353.1 hypothetical protein [Gallionella sp.]
MMMNNDKQNSSTIESDNVLYLNIEKDTIASLFETARRQNGSLAAVIFEIDHKPMLYDHVVNDEDYDALVGLINSMMLNVARKTVAESGVILRSGLFSYVALITDGQEQKIADDIRLGLTSRPTLFNGNEVDIVLRMGVACIEDADRDCWALINRVNVYGR